MSQPEQRSQQSGDLRWAISPPAQQTRCWFCSAPGATAHDTLGGGPGGGNGARIPVCPPGTGCRNGMTIYHGPPNEPHEPDADCRRCILEARASQPRRRRGRPPNGNRR
jgi:hypothetical protein